jgi:hypothetical protein
MAEQNLTVFINPLSKVEKALKPAILPDIKLMICCY